MQVRALWFHRGVAGLARLNQAGRLAIVTALVLCAIAAAGAVLVTGDGSGPAVAVATSTTTTTTTVTTTTTTVPPPDVPASTRLASPKGEIPAYDAPRGTEIAKVGFWYTYPMTMPIVERRGAWLRVMMPERPNGLTAWVRADQVTRSVSRWRMVVDLSETRVSVYKDGYKAWSAPVGIGKERTRTPTGRFFVAIIEKPGPPGYGPIVLDLNAHSEDIGSWDGLGDAIIAFHGPFGADELIKAGGGKVSNGCIRMLPQDQLKMDPITLGTPVDIVD
jgi:hypothetical protein